MALHSSVSITLGLQMASQIPVLPVRNASEFQEVDKMHTVIIEAYIHQVQYTLQVDLTQSMIYLHEEHPTVTPIVLFWYILYRLHIGTLKLLCIPLKQQTK